MWRQRMRTAFFLALNIAGCAAGGIAAGLIAIRGVRHGGWGYAIAPVVGILAIGLFANAALYVGGAVLWWRERQRND